MMNSSASVIARRTDRRLTFAAVSGLAARWGAILSVALLCGCFNTKDELVLEADGSGKVRIETRTSVPAEMLSGMGMQMGASDAIMYPPMTESEAKKFFPGKAFTVTAKEEKAGDSGRLLVIEAVFKDVNALLASPYARAHGLTLKVESSRLMLKALSGIEAAARFADMKDEGGMLGAQIPGLANLDKLKAELRSEFRVTLPNAIQASNGAQEGRSVTWIAERAKYTNGTEFAQKAGAVLEASCAADAIKMSPVTPTRLALVSFKELESGATAGQGSAPDAKKVAAAAKFVPYALQVTRALDLSGEGGSQENQAQLIGGVVLPREFAPQKWGAVKLEEVTDAKGNSLKMETSRDESFQETRFTSVNEDDAGEPAETTEERKTVTLRFHPPDWKVKEIARIKGSIGLQYLGAARHIVKLTNAVPASWIKQVSKEADAEFDSSQRALSSPALPELGLTVNFQMGMAQSGFTMLMLQVGGKKAVLSEAQVFDSEGRPWPTFFQQHAFGDEGSCSIIIAGRPTAPLSLAFLATSVGADVEVPILLEKIPVGRN